MFGFNQYSSPAAETPIQILFSDDETLGVAFLRHGKLCAWSKNENAMVSKY
jgi:hypothetical protein